MVRSINSIQNVQLPKMIAFKSSQEPAPVSSPAEIANLNGVDALASYNSAFINKSELYIPLLKPIPMPRDINSVDGEKIYNSKGKLECVVKETKDKKYVYFETGKNELRLNVINKQTGLVELEQAEYKDENGNLQTWLMNYDSQGREEAHADYYNYELKSKGITKYNKDGLREQHIEMFDDGTYIVYSGCNNKNYDINGNLTYENIYQQKPDGAIVKEIKYANGKPFSTEVKETTGEFIEEYSNYLKDPNLQRSECPEFISSIDNIEGEKTYFSNGQIESVRTPDGKIYERTFDGHCIILTDGNKTITFENYIADGRKCCVIEEDLGNATKQTQYFDIDNNKRGNVSYTKGNISKFVYFNEEGNPTSYEESDLSKEKFEEKLIFGIDFAPNGSVINVYHNYDER